MKNSLVRLPCLALLTGAILAGCSDGAGGDAALAQPERDAASGNDAASESDAASEERESGVAPVPDAASYACGSKPASPDSRKLPLDITAAAPDLSLRGGSDRLELYARTSSSLTEAQLSDVLARTCEALTFDRKEQGVQESETAMLPAVRVVVLDDAAYDQATQAPGTYGICYEADPPYSDAVVVPESGLAYLVDLDDTLAHELSHIIQGRLAPNDTHVTWFTMEGTATLAGTQYGMWKNHTPTDFVPEYLHGATGADATLTFERYGLEDKTTDLDQVGHDQALSAFFVEYLRVKHPRGDGGVGFPDVQARLLRAMVQVSEGADEPTGFAATMDGLSQEAAKGAYVKFLQDTVGDDQARFGGTLFE